MQGTPSKVSIHEVLPSKHKKGGIFIGNLRAAESQEILEKYHIRAVISAAKGTFLPHSKEILPNYLYIPAYDHPDFDITEYFEKSYEFIEKALRKTNVLVHCRAGISRSATIVIAYLMRKENKSWVESYRCVKQLRPIIEPNNGFLRQLKHFEDNVLKCNNQVKGAVESKGQEGRGVSCHESREVEAKENTEFAKEKEFKPRQLSGQRTPRTPRSKVRHRYRISQLFQKRSSVPYVINY